MDGILSTEPTPVDISAVISCYFEEKSIDEFHTRLSSALKATGKTYEIIYINDGSTDHTFEHLAVIYDADPNVYAIVDLFRNAGQSNAKTPGIMMMRGEALLMIDSDLQFDPEELPLLLEKYCDGYDVVHGYRRERHDPPSRVMASWAANIVMRRATGKCLHDFGCTFKLYRSRLAKGFQFDAFNPWRPVPVIAAAGRIAEVPVTHHPRRYGRSGQKLSRLFAHNMEHLVILSQKPFQILGFTCLAFSMLFLLMIGIRFVIPFTLLELVTPGLLLNAIVISLLITLFVLSMIGEFVIRSFTTLQKRPHFLIREIRRRTTRL